MNKKSNNNSILSVRVNKDSSVMININSDDLQEITVATMHSLGTIVNQVAMMYSEKNSNKTEEEMFNNIKEFMINVLDKSLSYETFKNSKRTIYRFPIGGFSDN